MNYPKQSSAPQSPPPSHHTLVVMRLGWLSDRMESCKPLVVFGYSCSILSRAAWLFAFIPWLLALTRIFDRVGKGLRCVCIAHFTDLVKGLKKHYWQIYCPRIREEPVTVRYN